MTNMFNTNPIPPGGWRVTGQVQQVVPNPGGGGVITGFKVTFTTSAGVNSSVFIAAADYSLANVQAAIAAQVAQLDAVSALTHESVT